ncbi:MAG TPA: porin family protein [Acidobacteriota bacterium]|nr:porin family protein [Acidobacteriota bacterium]
MRKLVLLVCFVLLFTFTSTAAAQIGKLGVGVHGIWTKSATQDDERVFAWGLHARARISPRLALEGSVDFRSETIDDVTISLYPMQFSALFYLLPASGAGIYGLFGLGWTRVSVDGDFFGEGAEDGEISYHWGFGIEVPMGGASTFFADVRYLNLDLNISKILNPDFDTKGWQANFGYSFYF